MDEGVEVTPERECHVRYTCHRFGSPDVDSETLFLDVL